MPFLAVLDAHTGFAEHEEEGEQLAVVTREPFGVSCNNRINQSGATARNQPLEFRPLQRDAAHARSRIGRANCKPMAHRIAPDFLEPHA